MVAFSQKALLYSTWIKYCKDLYNILQSNQTRAREPVGLPVKPAVRRLKVQWLCAQHGQHTHRHQEPPLRTVKGRKLASHVTRHDNLSKTVLQGTWEGSRRLGGQRKNWLTSIKEWTGRPVEDLLTVTQDRQEWRALSAAACNQVLPPSDGYQSKVEWLGEWHAYVRVHSDKLKMVLLSLQLLLTMVTMTMMMTVYIYIFSKQIFRLFYGLSTRSV